MPTGTAWHAVYTWRNDAVTVAHGARTVQLGVYHLLSLHTPGGVYSLIYQSRADHGIGLGRRSTLSPTTRHIQPLQCTAPGFVCTFDPGSVRRCIA